MNRVAPQDATMYWLSSRTRNDLFLLYCFDDSDRPIAELRASVAQRSAAMVDLRVRLREEPADLDYPSWIPNDFATGQFIEHFLLERNWLGVCTALGKLLGTGVDASTRPWMVHVFRGIEDAPAPGRTTTIGPAMVVVLQMSHALADGRRAAEIARALFTEPAAPAIEPSSVTEKLARRGVRRLGLATEPILVDSALALLRMPIRFAQTAVRGFRAFQAQRELAELTAAGELPAPGPEFAPSLVNRVATGSGIVIGGAGSGEQVVGAGGRQGGADYESGHQVRMIVREITEVRMPGRTVTVAVLTAVSIALERYLAVHGEPVDRLGAQVPMALSGNRIAARNNYRSLGVDLFAGEPDPRVRADKIATALADRRVRAQHPLLHAQDLVTAVTPAPLLRRDVERYPIDTVPGSIAGHTVVSSVYRGLADLTFGGASVRFTGGFPAIGSVMHLTHGVHGLGDTVTISVHTDLPDIDSYTELLRDALDEVVQSEVPAD